MNILGSSVVDSSLMFYSVAGSSTVSGITGYYGGYVSTFTCASSTCSLPISDADI